MSVVRWEYKTHTMITYEVIETVLNDYGADGWELVSAHVHYGRIILYLKRQRKGGYS